MGGVLVEGSHAAVVCHEHQSVQSAIAEDWGGGAFEQSRKVGCCIFCSGDR